jgi:hypothetical protein
MWALVVAVDDPLFIAVAHSAKVRCIVCDRQGDQTDGTGWQHACLLGHAPCPSCGKIIGLTNAGRVRQSHTGCPNPITKVAPVRAALPAAGAPLRHVRTFGAEGGVTAVARVEPGLVGQLTEHASLDVVDE